MSSEQCDDPFFTVAIGVLSPSLDSVVALLKHLLPLPGMALVVQHMDLDPETIQVTISASTTLPIVQARAGTVLEKDHIYLLPANGELILKEGVFDKLPLGPVDGLPAGKTTLFFQKMALALGPACIGVLLTDMVITSGDSGLEAIRSEGGVTFVEARKDGTESALNYVADERADFVLPADAMAEELARLVANGVLVDFERTPAMRDVSAGLLDELAPPSELEVAKARILELLKQSKGMDFSNYKLSTVMRRLERRTVLTKSGSLMAYADLIEREPAELDALHGDMLIHVTSFFRAAEAFEALELHLTTMLEQRGAKEPFRVWVPGCSTGQEVYSLAMILLELCDRIGKGHLLQIFATDLEEAALDKARSGNYAESAMRGVSDERRQIFFTKSDTGYRVAKRVRDIIVFARHNFVADPPFSGMDLISCRNVLIYMEDTLQRKAALLFHFALKRDGILFLGNAEAVGTSSDLFDQVDKRYKIFLKKAVPTPTMPFKQAVPSPSSGSPPLPSSESLPTSMPLILRLQREADRVALLRYAPPGVLVDEQLQILQFRGDTSAVLRPPIGTATMDLMKMARPGLMSPLKTALAEARETRHAARVENVALQGGADSGGATLNLEVMPLRNLKDPCYLITFEDTRTALPKPPLMDISVGDGNYAELERELAEARDAAQSHLENYEAAIEELQASNEEVKAAYEELQSTNEELESTNEELTTVNEEIASRNLELSRLVNDLNNLHQNIDTGIILLGKDMIIRSFTPLAGRTFNLLPSDIGHPLNRIRHPVESHDLEHGIAEVTRTLEMREFELQDAEGHWYALRVHPYKTLDGGTDGTVLVMVDIDKHLEAVRLSETRYRRLFEASQDGILLLDPVTEKIIDANPCVCALLHRTKEELASLELWELGFYLDKLGASEALNRLAHEKTFRMEDRQILLPDHSTKTVEVTISLYVEDEQKVVECNIRDITERKAGEEAGRRLAALVNSSQDAITSLDLNGNITSWNNAAERLFGYSHEEIVGRPITVIVPQYRAHEEAEIFARLKRGESIDHFDTERLRKDGTTINVSLTISPIIDASGELIGASKITRDISDRIAAQSALRESEERFRTVADAAPVMLWIVDITMGATYFNKAWLQFTGRSLGQELGHGWLENIHPEDLEQAGRIYREAFDARLPVEMEYRLKHQSEGYRWVLDHGVPLIDPNGVFVGYIGGCTDIHSQKEATQAIQHAKEAVESSSRAKDQFLAALSHELRTPLSPVLTISGLRAKDDDLEDEVREDFAMIRKNVELEARLIDDLLDLTRITEGKLTLNLETVDLRDLLQDALKILHHDIQAKALRVTLDASPNPLWVKAEAVRLQQVCWNVLKNAVKFSEPRRSLVLRAFREGDEAHLTVTDEGIGITDEEMPGIFDAFSQGKVAAGQKFGGLGLGLTISALLVKEHQGRIWAESPGRDQGATFRIALPLTAEPEPKAASAPGEPSPAQTTVSGAKLLLVEDHDDTRKTLSRLLNRKGYQVKTAGSIAEALGVANEWQFDLVISDLGLPDGTGHQLMAALREKHDLTGIALSGYGMAEDLLRSAEAGFSEHLIKPVDFARLEEALGRILDKKG